MPEKYRLKKNYQFNYIFKRGKSVATKNIVLVFAKNNTNRLKIGFSVGKKLGKAVKRNKLKRRLKECVRSQVLNIDTQYNYIFIPRESIKDITFADIKKDIEYLINKAKKTGIQA